MGWPGCSQSQQPELSQLQTPSGPTGAPSLGRDPSAASPPLSCPLLLPAPTSPPLSGAHSARRPLRAGHVHTRARTQSCSFILLLLRLPSGSSSPPSGPSRTQCPDTGPVSSQDGAWGLMWVRVRLWLRLLSPELGRDWADQGRAFESPVLTFPSSGHLSETPFTSPVLGQQRGPCRR